MFILIFYFFFNFYIDSKNKYQILNGGMDDEGFKLPTYKMFKKSFTEERKL